MNITFRTTITEKDLLNIREIVKSTGFFHDYEIDVAVELAEIRLEQGISSDYYFIFAEVDGVAAGYSCFGPIACTKSSFDLYWIAAHNDFRGKGIGKQLIEETCKYAKQMGCTIIYAETSAREQYAPTQHFYDNNNFIKEAQIKDFYDEGDDKLIYSRRLNN